MNILSKAVKAMFLILILLCIAYYFYLRNDKNCIDRPWMWLGIAFLIMLDLIMGMFIFRSMDWIWVSGNIVLFCVFTLIVFLIWRNGETAVRGNETTTMIFAGGFQKNGQLSTDTLHRMDAGISQGTGRKKFVITGGLFLEGNTESDLMKQILVENAVDEKSIITDENAQDTHQNIENCKEYITDPNCTVVVSSRYHLLRIKMLFAKVGIREISVVGAQSDAALLPHNYIREICSILRDTYYGWTDWSVLWK